MKFQSLSALILGAGLLQASASPLRVMIVSSIQEAQPPVNLRYGHAMMDSNAANIASVHPSPAGPGAATFRKGARPCGGRFRQKAVELSNMFRQAVGWPTIETEGSKHTNGPMIQVVPFIGSPPTFIEVQKHRGGHLEGKFRGGEGVHILPVGNLPHPHPHHDYQFPMYRETFFVRFQRALMSLGPWEGRAVAFVIGCGIGVLLRMFWVLTVVTFRAIKGQGADEHEYSHITFAKPMTPRSSSCLLPSTLSPTRRLL